MNREIPGGINGGGEVGEDHKMQSTEKSSDLKVRTKDFAVRCIRLVDALPAGRASDVIGRQLLKSATSVGANYRSACRGRSTAEFCSKLGIVEEEADESAYWMELLIEAEIVNRERLEPLHREAGEIVAMVVASNRTARQTS
jgi:four helix bundle protein